MRFTHLDTPLGRLLITGDGAGLRRILFPGEGRSEIADATDAVDAPDSSWQEDDGSLGPVVRQLESYFARRLEEFDLELAPEGTSFQRRVWDELLRIPYGETLSYGELARRLGRPDAARAVGAANGANPLPIVIPCHRVIGADGRLVGYGGGLEIKRTLLDLEQGGWLF